jgi:bifunctional UDP-N-acetylglucosamine pyrophosphorylase/glucosamine-1-phosphate N-acetyltransferase
MQLTLDALAGKSAAVLTAHLADATGYGRIVRNTSNGFEKIVEHRDATDSELLLTEVNSGVYAFDAKLLRESLAKLTTDNSQGEQYLTDVFGILRSEGHEVSAIATSEENILGVNDRRQLADAGAILRTRINNEWMLAGVTMVDPNSVWIDRTAVLEPDVTLFTNVSITGASTIRGGATIGPDCSLHDTVADHCATVIRTTSNGAVIGEGANVGPYTYLRPGTVLGAGAKAGGFVEMKNANLGVNAKVPHLSYVGDATIGEGTNIGAATVFVNYDGQEKHHTQVGDHVRIGSDTMLVAPLVIGDGAYTAAGSVITEDVPAGSMAVGRARQRNIVDWVLRRRPGSDSAKAALADSFHKNSK